MDWDKLYRMESAYKVPLPAYPFDRVRCWIEIPETPAIQAANPELLQTFREVAVT